VQEHVERERSFGTDDEGIDLDLGYARVASNERAETLHAIDDRVDIDFRPAAAAAKQRRTFELA
jgi:hypothetical protein